MKGLCIGFAGMTHLGINSAAATAARGFSVLGFDADARLIEALSCHRSPLAEPGLADCFAAHAERLAFSADPAELARCDIVYISADVPTDENGRSDLAPIGALIETVAGHARTDAIIVVLCQVPPGFTRAIRSVPPERLVYQVETLIFGRAIERALHPERFIVGLADPARGLPEPYKRLLEAFGCPILPMRYESAELAKISINCCLVASVSVANMLAELSEAIGADWTEIAPSLKLDKRIGPHAYLTPGLGISGGNLERDLRTVMEIGGRHGTDTGVVAAWIGNSHHRKDWLWRCLSDKVLAKKPDARIALLGLAYKENTNSIKTSPALQLLSHLSGHDGVSVYDPVVPADCAPRATAAANALSCAAGSDVLVIATPWPEFGELRLEALRDVMAGRVLIDPYRMLDGDAAVRAGFEWHTLGVGHA
jgi:UDPglucose 6-dehydrogenase